MPLGIAGIGDHVGSHRTGYGDGEHIACVVDIAGQVGKLAGRHAKILGQYVFGRMGEPIANQEGRIFRKVAVVKDEEELTAIFQGLDGMWNARGKIPQVADAHIVEEVASILVHRADAGAPVEHIGPLRFLVPVQLAYPAGIQPHIDTCQRGGDGQLARRHLPRPAAGREAIVRQAERKFQVGDGARVGAGRRQDIGILPVQGNVAWAGIGPPFVAPDRLRHLVHLITVLWRSLLHVGFPFTFA